MTERIVWAILNSELVQGIIVSAVVAWLAKWWASETGLKWKKWEGILVTLAKAAERAIPDGIENKGAKRLDWVLREFVERYGKETGVSPTASDLLQIEGIVNEIHAQLEANGNLKKVEA